MDFYLKIIQQLGAGYKDLSITIDEYRELVKEIDKGKYNLKNSKKINDSLAALLALKKKLKLKIITEKSFNDEKARLLKEIKNNI